MKTKNGSQLNKSNIESCKLGTTELVLDISTTYEGERTQLCNCVKSAHPNNNLNLRCVVNNIWLRDSTRCIANEDSI